MKRVVERLLNLCAFLLTADRPVTAEEIRHTVPGYDRDSDQAFRRMFERDKDLLRKLGVPLERRPTDAWEVEHGYLIPPDRYELADPGLSDEERAALGLAAQVVRLGGQPSGAEALFKLGGAAMTAGGEPLGAELGLPIDSLAAAFGAVTERRLLDFAYRGRSRTVRPYGLVHRRGHWYLVGLDEESHEVRSFRMDRVDDLAMGEEREAFRRPAGFRAKDALAQTPWEAGPEAVEATVRFDPAVAWWAHRQLPAGARLVEQEGGGLLATLPVANPEALVGWALDFGDQAELLSPAELRELLVARVEGRR